MADGRHGGGHRTFPPRVPAEGTPRGPASASSQVSPAGGGAPPRLRYLSPSAGALSRPSSTAVRYTMNSSMAPRHGWPPLLGTPR